MSYFLKKTTPSKKGTYLQIYQSVYIPKIGNRNKSYQKLGYVSDLIDSGITDPIAFYTDYVKKLNDSHGAKKELQISDSSTQKYAGHFLR